MRSRGLSPAIVGARRLSSALVDSPVFSATLADCLALVLESERVLTFLQNRQRFCFILGPHFLDMTNKRKKCCCETEVEAKRKRDSFACQRKEFANFTLLTNIERNIRRLNNRTIIEE